jgi:DNA-binding response OmpR family regulator
MARILVIDDEPDVLLLCRVNLGHAGHDVLEAADGWSGVEIARGERPDLIVLDLMLPGRDGTAILHDLAEDDRTSSIPVLMLTAKTQLEDRERCRDAGAAAFLTKPFSPMRLAELVEALTIMTPSELVGREDVPELLLS